MFARSIINRLWFRFYGHGLVMRIDQMHAKNESSHPELLQWLTRDLLAHNYDLKRLIEGLVSSRAYARSSEWKGTRAGQGDIRGRRRSAADAGAMGRVSPFGQRPRGTEDRRPMRHPASKALMRSSRSSEDVRRPDRATPGRHANRHQRIAQIEQRRVRCSRSTGDKLVTRPAETPGCPATDRSSRLGRSCLAPPQRPKSNCSSNYLEQRQDRPDEALQHMVWALLNSPEFRFNH